MEQELDPDIVWLREKMELLKMEMEVFKCEFVEKFGKDASEILQ